MSRILRATFRHPQKTHLRARTTFITDKTSSRECQYTSNFIVPYFVKFYKISLACFSKESLFVITLKMKLEWIKIDLVLYAYNVPYSICHKLRTWENTEE